MNTDKHESLKEKRSAAECFLEKMSSCAFVSIRGCFYFFPLVPVNGYDFQSVANTLLLCLFAFFVAISFSSSFFGCGYGPRENLCSYLFQ